MESDKYVHGYSKREAMRLNDQAATLDDIILSDSARINNTQPNKGFR